MFILCSARANPGLRGHTKGSGLEGRVPFSGGGFYFHKLCSSVQYIRISLIAVFRFFFQEDPWVFLRQHRKLGRGLGLDLGRSGFGVGASAGLG